MWVGLTCSFVDSQALLLADRSALLALLVPALLAWCGLGNWDALLGWFNLANLLGNFLAHLLRYRVTRLLGNIVTHVLLLASALVGCAGLGNIGTLFNIGGTALLLIN